MSDKSKRSQRLYQKHREGIKDLFMREAGPHDDKHQKKKERKIREALYKLDFEELEEL